MSQRQEIVKQLNMMHETIQRILADDKDASEHQTTKFLKTNTQQIQKPKAKIPCTVYFSFDMDKN